MKYVVGVVIWHGPYAMCPISIEYLLETDTKKRETKGKASIKGTSHASSNFLNVNRERIR